MTTSPSNVTLPIAEVFTSIHGEGFWAGTPMTFIRLAGCTVGKVFQNNGPDPVDFPMFPDGKHNFVCTTFDGRTFPCDTDYRRTDVKTVDELMDEIPSWIKHVCITGGEPFMHQKLLFLLCTKLRKRDITVHFETSGTILIDAFFRDTGYYITCSPKANYLPDNLKRGVGEVRIMVDGEIKETDIRKVLDCVYDKNTHIFFAPLSSPHSVTEFDPESMAKAQELLQQFPGSRISIQMHKVLNVR
jgi:organic radical activating enzyme